MAIKVVEDENIIDGSAKFKVTCPKCGALIEYLGHDVSIHKRFPRGYVYCPKCRNPIAHDKDNYTGEVASKEELTKEANKNGIGALLMFLFVLLGITAIVIIVLLIAGVIK